MLQAFIRAIHSILDSCSISTGRLAEGMVIFFEYRSYLPLTCAYLKNVPNIIHDLVFLSSSYVSKILKNVQKRGFLLIPNFVRLVQDNLPRM